MTDLKAILAFLASMALILTTGQAVSIVYAEMVNIVPQSAFQTTVHLIVMASVLANALYVQYQLILVLDSNLPEQ